MSSVEEEISAYCKKLRLSHAFAERAMSTGETANQEYLLELLKKEVEMRAAGRIQKFMNAAGFPQHYRPDQYHTEEIDFPAGITFQSLLDLDFYESGKNVIMYGGTGTGKTMLSILIGMSACQKGIPVRFYRTTELVNLFAEAKERGRLSVFTAKLNKAKILILDEFGYVPYDRIGSELLYDYLSSIHEQKPVILNTNLEFSQWVNILYDERMTAALIGRLTHHVELILFPGTTG